MRGGYIVSYDISHPKRLRHVYKTMLGFGDHIQLSVFWCELSRSDLTRMISKLEPIIHHDEDQVLIIHIGPAEGRRKDAIRALGKAYRPCPREPLIV